MDATCASSQVPSRLESFFSHVAASMRRGCFDDVCCDGGRRRTTRRRTRKEDGRKRWARNSGRMRRGPCSVRRRRVDASDEKILQCTTDWVGRSDVSHGVALKRKAPRREMAVYSVKSTSSFGLTRVHLRRCEGQAKEAVLFFPGDRMESDDELVQRLTDPDGMLDVLEKKYPIRDVMVVQPTRYEPPGQANAYACYDNFLERSTWTGDPIGYHTEQGKGLKHLAAILQEAETKHGMVEDLPVTLIGFSKGCVVLNQLLTELAVLVDGGSNTGLRSRGRIHAIHFVDAGLNRPGAYPTDMDVAQYLATNGAHVYFHGTPRQWNGLTRAWILEEKSRSLALLRELGVVVTERLYLEDRCYDDHAAHFEILELFDPHIPPPVRQDPCE